MSNNTMLDIQFIRYYNFIIYLRTSTGSIGLDAIPSLEMSSAIITRSVMPSRMGPHVVHLIETSRTSIHPGSIEA